jgi:hypothetical protein
MHKTLGSIPSPQKREKEKKGKKERKKFKQVDSI